VELKHPVSKKLADNIAYLKKRLGYKDSFDFLIREFQIGNKDAALAYLDGFTSGDRITLIMQTLLSTTRDELTGSPLQKVLKHRLPYYEVETVTDLEQAVEQILSGPVVLLLDGAREAVVIDTREYPGRQPEEPDVEKVTRGARDGFVETMLFNVTLVRRRLRDPNLRTKIVQIGNRSRTDVCLVYLDDIANHELVRQIHSRLQKVDVDGLPMGEKSLEEFIVGGHWNPFPRVRYTERPDVAAIHLLEGHVLVIVDTSPSAIIAPVTLFHHLQHPEEYRNTPFVGLYIRWVRLFGVALSTMLAPLWLLLAIQPSLLPDSLKFIGPKEASQIPLFVQFILASFGLDLIRMASIHTPTPLATALGLVGGILIGQIAVDVGIFSPEVLLYIGLVAIGLFATPSWELGLANRLVMLFILLATGIFKLYGFIVSTVLVLLTLAFTRSFGVPYLWPLIPFNGKALLSVLVREPVPVKIFRPSFLNPDDPDRRPPETGAKS